MIVAVFLLAQSLVSPPPMVSVPAPVVISPSVPVPSRPPRETYTVDVLVRAGSDTLFEGPLRVATLSSTQFHRDQIEPSPENCAQGYDSQTTQTSFSISLASVRFTAEPSRLGVSVRWSRPGDARCPARSNGRAVEMNDTVRLAPGQTVLLSGDAALTVRLTRR